MISHLTLTKIEAISPSVSLQTDNNGFEFLIIEHNKLSAALTLHGAHLIHFQKTDQQPIIWLSKDAVFDSKKAIRGGVPICWPWFGPASPDLGTDLPSHGFARTSKWQLDNVKESSDGVEIALKLNSNAETLAIWPYEFELTLQIVLNDELKLVLITENKGDQPFNYRSALHTYLNISTPDAVQLSGLNEQFYNSLHAKRLETGPSTLLVDQAIDSIYKKSTTNILLTDQNFQRNLSVVNTGNDSEVIWSPWYEGAKSLTDMPDDGYQTMLCIESAITQGSGQQVNVGAKHTLTTLIKSAINESIING